jgi:hypothetical protein
MKIFVLFACFSLGLLTCCTSCEKNAQPGEMNAVPGTPVNPTGSKMKIVIGAKTFTATLYDNATTRAFNALLPLTVQMVELNGNEKYAGLSNGLPTSALNPGIIQNGDLMLYGSSTLVLFYKTFTTSYSYTRIGKVDNVEGLAAALGSGNVTVSYTLE